MDQIKAGMIIRQLRTEHHMTQAQLDALGTEHTWWLTLVCTPLMLAQVYAFRKGA